MADPENASPDDNYIDPKGLTLTETLVLMNRGIVRPPDDVIRERGRKGAGFPNTDADQMAVAFARVLRRNGLPVPVGTVVTYAEALAAVGIESGTRVYWAGRAVLVRRPEDLALYNVAFTAFWFGKMSEKPEAMVENSVTLAIDDEDGNEDDEEPNTDDDDSDPGDVITVRFSAAETLRNKDFAEYTADEFAEARTAMQALRVVGSPRRSRRLRQVRGSRVTRKPDVRRTVRKALRTDGLAIHRAFQEPSERPRRIVLLLDVSGSMESYARALLRFSQAAVIGRGRVEVFALGTRLTRITRELTNRNPDEALKRASARVLDWSGGTRLGDGIRTFNDQWGVRGMARQSIVVVLSDGWDRGEPKQLGEQMQRLHRVAYRVVWVNPLKAAPGYQPLARGMAAALPHVDTFIEGHSMASLEELAKVLAG
jgi:uncharacterized protein